MVSAGTARREPNCESLSQQISEKHIAARWLAQSKHAENPDGRFFWRGDQRPVVAVRRKHFKAPCRSRANQRGTDFGVGPAPIHALGSSGKLNKKRLPTEKLL
jgi:hypothetical protein